MILATLAIGLLGPATAADFFPLNPGMKWIYEEKSESKMTVIDEVSAKPVYFDDQASYAILRKSKFNQILDTTYYRVDGPAVMIVGYAEDRRASTPNVGDTIDLTKKAERVNVLLRVTPSIPVFKFDGGPTQWTFAEIPTIKGNIKDEPFHTEETSIVASSKPGPLRDVLGKKVETLVVHAEIELGTGTISKRQVEDSVYGRGIGLIESKIKTTLGGKTQETRTTLVGMEPKKEGS